MNKKNIIILSTVLFLQGVEQVTAKEPDNWIKTSTYTKEEAGGCLEDISFYDGLGNKEQTISLKASSEGFNVVQPVFYDNMGREDARVYLPYVTQSNRPVKVVDPFSSHHYESHYNNSEIEYAFYINEYENSPLNRVLSSRLPGSVFRQDLIKSSYNYDLNNISDKVIFMEISSATDDLKIKNYWKPKSLYKNTTKNEDGVVNIVFSDNHGREIMSRSILDSNHEDTYYVFDERGNLSVVVSPEGSRLLNQQILQSTDANLTLNLNIDMVKDFCYTYRYDNRNRLSGKRIPGKGWEYFVYDKCNRLVMSQDGNQSINEEWVYTVYDKLGRITEQNIIKVNKYSDRDILQEHFDETNYVYPDDAKKGDIHIPFVYDKLAAVKEHLLSVRYGRYEYIDKVIVPDPKYILFLRGSFLKVTGLVAGGTIDVDPENLYFGYFGVPTDPIFHIHTIIPEPYEPGKPVKPQVSYYYIPSDCMNIISAAVSKYPHIYSFSSSLPIGVKAPLRGYEKDNQVITSTFTIPYELSFAPVEGVVENCEIWNSNLKTYEQVAVLGYNEERDHVERAFYYDHKGRVVQTVEKNHTGGISRYSTKYDFTGNVLASHESHQPAQKIGYETYLKGRYFCLVQPISLTFFHTADAQGRYFIENQGFTGRKYTTVRGEYLIGRRYSIITSESGMKSYSYYYVPEDCVDIIQQTIAMSSGQTNTMYFTDEFIGKGIPEEGREAVLTSQNDTKLTEYSYDHRGRLLSECTTLNGGKEAKVGYDYDELGRLASKSYGGREQIVDALVPVVQGKYFRCDGWRVPIGHTRPNPEETYFDNYAQVKVCYEIPTNSGAAAKVDYYIPTHLLSLIEELAAEHPTLYSISTQFPGTGEPLTHVNGKIRTKEGMKELYEYNIQGWLTRQAFPLFGYHLKYYDPRPGVTPSYTGNITEMRYVHSGQGFNGYAFEYDKIGRLTAAEHAVGTDIWRDDQWTQDGRFDEKGISYDLNGNIRQLSRSYSSPSIIDDLSYTYTGNQLTRLRHSNTSGSVNRPSARYEYDANGNMTWDTSKDMDFRYNCLNLLESAAGSDGGVSYSWLADGTKVKVVEDWGDGYLYLGSLVYRLEDGQPILESTGFGAGRIIASQTSSGTTYEPHYHVTDHLGSVRVVFTMDSNNNASVVSQNDYYPFGKRHAKPSLVSGGQTRNRFLYNGKEEQTTGNLRLLDYGARMYDPEIGRWLSVDPLAEKYYPFSPYSYCLNNPIIFVDPDGRSVDWVKNIKTNNYEWMDNVNSSENTPSGYSYIGNSSFDILKDMGISPSHSVTQNRPFITTGSGGPVEKNVPSDTPSSRSLGSGLSKGVVTGSLTTASADIFIHPIIESGAPGENNVNGIKYNGLEISSTLIQSASGGMNATGGGLSVNVGGKTFISPHYKPKGHTLRMTGTTIDVAKVIVPGQVTHSNPLNSIKISAGTTRNDVLYIKPLNMQIKFQKRNGPGF